jgi:hypothetical protein
MKEEQTKTEKYRLTDREAADRKAEKDKIQTDGKTGKLMGNCDICVKHKILVINKTKFH